MLHTHTGERRCATSLGPGGAFSEEEDSTKSRKPFRTRVMGRRSYFEAGLMDIVPACSLAVNNLLGVRREICEADRAVAVNGFAVGV